MFCASIVEAADLLWLQGGGRFLSWRQHPHPLVDTCGDDAVKLEKASYRAFLDCMTPEAAKQCAALAVAEAKARAWEKFGETMENDFWTTSKRFWATIQRLRTGTQCTVNTMHSGDGVLLTSNKDVVDWTFSIPAHLR